MKWMNSYTLLTLVVIFIILMNTLLRGLLNGGTLGLTTGIVIIVCFVWFILVNVIRVIDRINDFDGGYE